MYEPAPSAEIDVYARRPSDLQELGDLPDWRVARGEPDIRGWAVFDADNSIPLGSVEELLVSTQAGQVVFIVVHTGEVIGESDVDYGLHGHLNNRHIPISLDRVEIDIPDNRVIFTGSIDDLQNAPEYDPASRDFDTYYDYWSRV